VLPAAAGISAAAYDNPALLSAGFHRAVLICAVLCVAAGVLAALTIRNPRPEPETAQERPWSHCAVDSPPPCPTPAAAAARPSSRPPAPAGS
jgi:hypothetical protein